MIGRALLWVGSRDIGRKHNTLLWVGSRGRIGRALLGGGSGAGLEGPCLG